MYKILVIVDLNKIIQCGNVKQDAGMLELKWRFYIMYPQYMQIQLRGTAVHKWHQNTLHVIHIKGKRDIASVMSHTTFWTDVLDSRVEFDLLAVTLLQLLKLENSNLETGKQQAQHVCVTIDTRQSKQTQLIRHPIIAS